MNYSVLMSVYKKENPIYLSVAMESILNQTVLTDDFVLIEDGALGVELENVIRKYEENYEGLFHVIRREENRGLGISLQEGLAICKNEYVARMDSDDYSCPNRMELEFSKLLEGYDLVGSNIDEFSSDPENIVATKKMPSDQQSILNYAKLRNPFNHPSVMFRKTMVLQAGGYRDLFRLEDYDLWIRMLYHGARCCNIQESLVRMRVDDEFYRRRGGKANLKSHLYLKKMMLQNHQISKWEFMKGSALMTGRAFCPGFIKQKVYKEMLRK